MTGINTHPDHLRRSGGKLADFGDKISSSGQKLATAGQNLVSHAGNDRSGIGAVVAKAMGRGVEITGKVFTEGGRVVSSAGKRLHTTADLHEGADEHGSSLLRRLHPDASAKVHPHSGGSSTGGRGRRSSAGSARDHVGGNPRDHAIPDIGRTKSKDPVDLVTGEVLLTQTDLELPGELPLVLTRTHLSSYRVGRLFGPNWASTLDQRLEVDEHGAVFVADDGVLLVYPVPADDAVLPVEGARWPLTRSGDGYRLDQPELGRQLSFTADGALVTIANRVGDKITIERGPDGTPTALRHSGGYLVTVTVADGLVTALSVADARVAGFGYAEGFLTEVTGETDQPLAFGYDQVGRLTEWVDRNGMWYRYHYDGAGRCVRAEGAEGQLSLTLDFDVDNRITTATDSLGHATTYEYNEAAQVVAVVDPLGNRTVSEWDRYDRLLARTDPLGRTIRYEHDERGDLVRVTRPDGSQSVTEYDDRHLPVTFVDPDGAIWRRQYDEVGNVVAVVDPAGTRTVFGYDDRRHLAAVTDALGGVTLIESDAAGLPVRLTDPLGATTTYTRDAAGRVTAIDDAVGGATRLEWSASGKLLARVLPDGSRESWDYDGEGNLVSVTDAAGRTARTEYAGFDLPVAEVDVAGLRTSYTYDTELRLTSVTNAAGLVWRYVYDAAGYLASETDFDGRTLGYTRDAAGQVIAASNGAGQVTTFNRDALGRVVHRQSEDVQTWFAYDAADRLVRARNQDVELVLTRDALGRVTAESCDGRTVSNTYDVLGRRITRVTPTGAVSRWTYDAAGYPSALDASGQVLGFGYDAAGREISRSLRDVRLEQTWDANHRLHTQALTAPGSAVGRRLVQRRAYTYRPDGAVTNVVDQLAGVRQFELDPLGRATAAIAPDRRETYGYDGAGNVTGPGRAHAGTLLVAANGARMEYDRQGRLTARHSTTLSGQRRTWRYSWNSDDRLVGVTTPDQVSWRYVYDPLGRRVAKLRLAADGQVAERTWFTWDATTLAEQTRVDGASTTWDYQPGMHSPVAQTDRVRRGEDWDARFYAIVTDLVGTPTELVTADGELAWRQQATLWGSPLISAPQRAYCPLRFPGQYHDLETGHHYNLQRFYDPNDAAYLSADPLRLDGGPNPHAYVPNPLTWIDPLGLVPYNLPRGYTSSPVFTDDPYHESKVDARREEWRQHFGSQIEQPSSPEEDRDRLARQARNEVRNGRGPSEIHRIDGPNTAVPGQQWHAQRKGKGSPALNQDGTFHDGDPQFSAKTHKWLRKYGWKTP